MKGKWRLRVLPQKLDVNYWSWGTLGRVGALIYRMCLPCPQWAKFKVRAKGGLSVPSLPPKQQLWGVRFWDPFGLWWNVENEAVGTTMLALTTCHIWTNSEKNDMGAGKLLVWRYLTKKCKLPSTGAVPSRELHCIIPLVPSEICPYWREEEKDFSEKEQWNSSLRMREQVWLATSCQ